MLTPQEIEVWYLIPAIRKNLVLELKQFCLKQTEIAKLLDITGAAVSQYIKSKRAKNIEFNDEIKQIIKDSAIRLMKKPEALRRELMFLTKTIKKKGCLCHLHKKIEQKMSKECKVCFDI